MMVFEIICLWNIVKLLLGSFKMFPTSDFSPQQSLPSDTGFFFSLSIAMYFYFTVSCPFIVGIRTAYFGKDYWLSCI